MVILLKSAAETATVSDARMPSLSLRATSFSWQSPELCHFRNRIVVCALLFSNDLGAKQHDDCNNLYTDEGHNRNGDGTVNDIYHLYDRVIPDQHTAGNLPKHRCGYPADERITKPDRCLRHNQIDGGEHQHFTNYSQEIQRDPSCNSRVQTPTQNCHMAAVQCFDCTYNKRYQHYSKSHGKYIQIGNYCGDQKCTPFNSGLMIEDHRHGVTQHGKCCRTEKQHAEKTDDTDHSAMFKKRLHLFGQRCRIAGDHHFQVR